MAARRSRPVWVQVLLALAIIAAALAFSWLTQYTMMKARAPFSPVP